MNRLLLALCWFALAFYAGDVCGQNARNPKVQPAQDPTKKNPTATVSADVPQGLKIRLHSDQQDTLKVKAGRFIDDFTLINPFSEPIRILRIQADGFVSHQKRLSDILSFSFANPGDTIVATQDSITVEVDADSVLKAVYGFRYTVVYTVGQETAIRRQSFPRRWNIAPEPTKTPSPLFFSVDDIRSSRWIGTPDRIEAIVTDTAERGGRIAWPLLKLHEKEGESLFSTHHDSVRYAVLNGNTATYWNPDSFLILPKGGTGKFQLEIFGLEPGVTYEAAIEFRGSKGEKISESFTIYFKRSVWVAFAILFAGVALAALLRHLLDQQSRWSQMKRLTELILLSKDILGTDTDPVHTDVQQAIRRHLELAVQRCRNAALKDDAFVEMETAFVDRLTLFGDWMELRQDFIALGGFTGNDHLTEVENYLRAEDGDAAEAGKSLAEARKDYATARGQVSFKMMGGVKGDALFRVKTDPQALLESIKRNLFLTELFSNTMTLVLASLSGLLLFWYPDMDWGGKQDLLIAFLWGFGLNTVFKDATFTRGAAGFVADRFRGKAEA